MQAVHEEESILTDATNDAEKTIDISQPFRVNVTIVGTSDILFHRWSVESIAEKAASAKGSTAKKTDDLESYVWRDRDGYICLPTEYIRMSIINAAKFKQDPRSPRKSAMDLFKAAFFATHMLCPLGKSKVWDAVDRRRVTVQRAGITRSRPCFFEGWRASAEFEIILPEYVSPKLFNDTLQSAGRLVGVGDNRPTYGRFQVVEFKVSDSLV